MSTYYRPLEPISLSDLMQALPTLGLKENFNPSTTETDKCITDGRSYIWVYGDSEGKDVWFSRYGGNYVEEMLESISEHFEVEIINEYDERWADDYPEDMMLLTFTPDEEGEMKISVCVPNPSSPNANLSGKDEGSESDSETYTSPFDGQEK